MSRIRLHRIYYPVTALGPGRRLGVWVQGCNRRCPGCLSPEMQPAEGVFLPVDDILRRIPADIAPEGLTISGGEPFDQPEGVAELAAWFVKRYSPDVLIYTGYTLEELQQRGDPATDTLLSLTAALVDGPYLRRENHGRGGMGSENQRLHLFRCRERYAGFETAPRTLQAIQEQGRLLLIGLPPDQP